MCFNKAIYSTQKLQNQCQELANANEIFKLLQDAGLIATTNPPGALTVEDSIIAMSSDQFSAAWALFIQSFEQWYKSVFSTNSTKMHRAENTILNDLQKNTGAYKLFYTYVANSEGQGDAVSPVFRTTPPTCSSPPCKDQALTANLPLVDYDSSTLTDDGYGNQNNTNAVMQYDLLRKADYNTTVLQNFPTSQCPKCMRHYVAWQWAATAATSAAMIGLNTTSNQYPNYDIDGRLKEVTIFGLNWQPPNLYVSYEDMQGGDIDETWDTTSCGPKPGLQTNSQIYTFTQDGTYLEIKEGKLYNPETGQAVRSVNKRDSVDLIQRTIQLSNNTGRFCTQTKPPQVCNGTMNGVVCANPNPVEVCVDSGDTSAANCFTAGPSFKETCYDINNNVLYVRSRLQDLRGRFWLTNTSGRLQVQ